MTKYIDVEIKNHGTFTFTAEAMDLTMLRYLPASPDQLRRLCTEMTGCEYDDVDTVTELLAVLADAEGKWMVEEKRRAVAICVEVRELSDDDDDDPALVECYETTVQGHLAAHAEDFAEDELVELSNIEPGGWLNYIDPDGRMVTITRI